MTSTWTTTSRRRSYEPKRAGSDQDCRGGIGSGPVRPTSPSPVDERKGRSLSYGNTSEETRERNEPFPHIPVSHTGTGGSGVMSVELIWTRSPPAEGGRVNVTFELCIQSDIPSSFSFFSDVDMLNNTSISKLMRLHVSSFSRFKPVRETLGGFVSFVSRTRG